MKGLALALTFLAALAGHFLASLQDQHAENAIGYTTDAPNPPTPFEEKNTIALPLAFPFADPFNPRHELNRAAAAKDRNEQLSRYIAIGHRAAQSKQTQRIEDLSPEFWEYQHYDLRGAFQAEWLRKDPQAYLQWAEPTFERLKTQNKLELFPSYHLAYFEPYKTLDLLAAAKNESLKSALKSSLLSTLIELDPETLWRKREQIASADAIISEAENKGLLPLVMDFWGRTEWAERSFRTDFLKHLASSKRTDLAAYLNPRNKKQFLSFLALEYPDFAASWPTVQSLSPNLYSNDFTPAHSAFFIQLTDSPDFQTWSSARSWLRLIAKIDHKGQLAPIFLKAIASYPDLSHSSSLRYSFTEYIARLQDSEPIETLYLSLENDHPMLASLEAFMIRSETDFENALIKRATREKPTPERLIKTLAYGNLETWPQTYLDSARDTLDLLSDEELMWSLSPNMLLSALELDQDRVQTLLNNADPAWLANSLNNRRFAGSVTMESISKLPEILQDLPEERRKSITETAHFNVITQAYLAEDKIPYLKLTRNTKEALIVSSQIHITEYRENKTLREEIQNHPNKNAILLGIVSDSFETQIPEPELAEAAKRIKTSAQLFHGGRDTVVSKIQTLPAAERFELVKTALIVSDSHHISTNTQKVLDLPFWSDEQKRELQDLNQRNIINDSLTPPPPPLEFW